MDSQSSGTPFPLQSRLSPESMSHSSGRPFRLQSLPIASSTSAKKRTRYSAEEAYRVLCREVLCRANLRLEPGLRDRSDDANAGLGAGLCPVRQAAIQPLVELRGPASPRCCCGCPGCCSGSPTAGSLSLSQRLWLRRNWLNSSSSSGDPSAGIICTWNCIVEPPGGGRPLRPRAGGALAPLGMRSAHHTPLPPAASALPWAGLD